MVPWYNHDFIYYGGSHNDAGSNADVVVSFIEVVLTVREISGSFDYSRKSGDNRARMTIVVTAVILEPRGVVMFKYTCFDSPQFK